MAQRTVEHQGVSIRLACLAFGISQTCFRYQAKQSAENVEIADHLIRLTHNQRNWGFGLCFLYLRNVKGYRWNHKRVYRIYRERSDGRSYRLVNVIDDFNREALAIDIDLSLPSERVIRALDQIIEWRGKPQAIRSDNRPEYISGAFLHWAERPATRSRTPISNATTGRSATTGSATTCSSRSPKYRNMQPSGCGPTITNAPTWRSVASPRNRSPHF